MRTGGVSSGPFTSLNVSVSVGDTAEAVRENTRRLAEAAGIRPDIATAHQVHGDRVVSADGREVLAATQPQETGADAVLALDPGVAAGVRVADCVPILLHDETSGTVAAVHSGWRGTRLSIAARGVRALQHAAGAEPRRILAAIGPSIGRCCYEVSAELAVMFRQLFGAEAADDPAKTPKPHLDLRFCVESALAQAGVPRERIEQVAGCTSCDIDAYFSHRRDKGRTGRHLAFIAAK
ncbi:MAG: peptidoglycan editing factor PgeF [Myxococcales bacterium]|nr:peptidoglycan editing factor PgeF [Myxococcales bacterium]